MVRVLHETKQKSANKLSRVCSEALEPRLAYSCQSLSRLCAIKQLEVFLLPLDGMLVHCRSLPAILLSVPTIHHYPFIYLGGNRHCESNWKCLAQEHNTSPTRAWTWTTRSAVECTNHKATTPPTKVCSTNWKSSLGKGSEQLGKFLGFPVSK